MKRQGHELNEGALRLPGSDESVGHQVPSDIENFYNVEKIVKKRIRNGKIQYFVKWENYDSCDNTWEPKENLSNISHMIEAYEENLRREQVAI